MSTDISNREESVGATNRAKILMAAEQEFAIHGFKGTRVQKIADRAGLPKTNILYYFKSKDGLYLALLEDILSLWNSSFDQATGEDDPAEILANYISEKMEISRLRPDASKIFALEIINGAANLNEFFKHQHTSWMQSRISVIQEWIDKGKIEALDPYYLLFNIWASSQHYADFSSQITELKGKSMDQTDFANATRNLIKLVLTGCNLTIPSQYR
jgi:TetR/AcrR family transcriptional regulator